MRLMKLCKGLPVMTVAILYMSWLPIHVQASHDQYYNQVGELSSSLDVFIHEYANRQLVNPRTGSLYNISLPANFSGIEVSVVIFRSGSFWFRGANFSSIRIPPRATSTQPYVKRLAIVYENLGNQSSQFYSVPGYSLVAPVIGFTAYESTESNTISNKKLNVSALGDPITVRFPEVEVRGKGEAARCVNFFNGAVHFRNLTEPNLCTSQGQGHFSIVVPSEPSSRKRQRYVFWWLIGFGVGLVGLVSFAVCVLFVRKLVKQIRIEKMEKRSEKGEAFDPFWVGASKMPSASMVRTQAVLEQSKISNPQ